MITTIRKSLVIIRGNMVGKKNKTKNNEEPAQEVDEAHNQTRSGMRPGTSIPMGFATQNVQTYQVEAPEAFNFNEPETWTRWIRRFERFRRASGLHTKPQTDQVNNLIYAMGDAADDIILSFKLSSVEADNYDTVISKFNLYFIPKTNVIFERARFNTRSQETGESIEDYATCLFKLAEKCDFDKYLGMKEEFLRDRLVVGIRDKKMSERLQLEDNLDFKKAMSILRQNEEVKRQTVQLQGKTVDAVKTKFRGNSCSMTPRSEMQTRLNTGNFKKNSQESQKPRRAPFQVSDKKLKLCKWCGQEPHSRKICPARESTCYVCKNRDTLRMSADRSMLMKLHKTLIFIWILLTISRRIFTQVGKRRLTFPIL